jgi:transposase-like protein
MVVRLREQFRELVRPKRRNVRVRPPVVEHARVSVVVDCNRADFSSEERQRAVQMVLDLQRDRKTQRQTIIQVASKFGMRRQTLHSWVRQVERAAAQLTDVPHTAPIPDAIEIPDPLGTDAEAG